MNFTDLESVLLLAVVVLLWRISSIKSWALSEESRANKYATFLISVGTGQGRVMRSAEGQWSFEPRQKPAHTAAQSNDSANNSAP